MSAVTSLLACVLLEAVPGQTGFAPQGFVDLFQACEYRYTGGDFQDHLFRYRLFVPRNLAPSERYPLLVWFHGAGDSGSDNVRSLLWVDSILAEPAHAEKYRFFVLVVQCPEGRGWFGSYAAPGREQFDPGDMLTVTEAIRQKTQQEHPIDPDRVYLAGVSSGGNACWEMAKRYPETFAAVVPMGAGRGDAAGAYRLAKLPIWVFHGAYDRFDSSQGDEMMAEAVKRAGGNIHLTLVESHGHDCWLTAFGWYDVMGWMLDQRRSALLCWTPPGCRPWRWWHIFGVPLACVACVGAGWYSEQRRRQRRRRSAPPLAEEAATPRA